MRVTADPTALLTPQGRELVARLETTQAGNQLALAERLRREYPADLVALAMAQQELRRTAEAKFSRAADMLFTPRGLRAVVIGSDRPLPCRPPHRRRPR